MADFEMCAASAKEYHDPADRRFHAQPIACPAGGPRLRLVDRAGQTVANDALRAAGDAAVAARRRRKRREEKPFAVMVRDLETVRALADVTPAGAELLAGARRPIVLLPRRGSTALAPAVAPGNGWVGLMLPYTPLHHLLVHDIGGPLVPLWELRPDRAVAAGCRYGSGQGALRQRRADRGISKTTGRAGEHRVSIQT